MLPYFCRGSGDEDGGSNSSPEVTNGDCVELLPGVVVEAGGGGGGGAESPPAIPLPDSPPPPLHLPADPNEDIPLPPDQTIPLPPDSTIPLPPDKTIPLPSNPPPPRYVHALKLKANFVCSLSDRACRANEHNRNLTHNFIL